MDKPMGACIVQILFLSCFWSSESYWILTLCLAPVVPPEAVNRHLILNQISRLGNWGAQAWPQVSLEANRVCFLQVVVTFGLQLQSLVLNIDIHCLLDLRYICRLYRHITGVCCMNFTQVPGLVPSSYFFCSPFSHPLLSRKSLCLLCPLCS